MAFNSILDLLNKWNIRGFVLLSLSLQFFLILFAPLRKKTTNKHIIFFLWLAYLMADWVATFTIGLISHNQGNSRTHAYELDTTLQSLWASFLLLHLGGPNTITAFSIEDTLLWRRHLLILIFQVGAIIYVFVQIFPSDKFLEIPAILVFLAGVIKNVERIVSLTISSFSVLKKLVNQVGHSLDKFSEELDFKNGYSNKEEAKLIESTVVKHAYVFYHIAMVFIGDRIFTRLDRQISRKYFHNVSAVDAFRVISVELHFIYEMFYTKALAIHCSWSHIFRFTAFFDIAMAFVLFSCLKKHRLPKLDVGITYFLFLGGIAFDVITLFMVVFSDWTVAIIERRKWHNRQPSKLDLFLSKMVSAIYDLRKPRFAMCEVKPNTNVMYAILDKASIFQRWSESISTCNLLSEILKESPRKMYKCNRCSGIIGFSKICSFPFHEAKKIIPCFDEAGELITHWRSLNVRMKYVSKNPLMKKLWIFIFKEVKSKSQHTNTLNDVRNIFEARGNVSLERLNTDIAREILLLFVTKAPYDANIITWHLATEMWYNKETVRDNEREFSKILSDYMLYLLLNRSSVVSDVTGIVQQRLRETWDELKVIISSAALEDVESVCMELFKCAGKPRNLRYVRSAVFDGINLAKKMERLGEEKWKVMSGVWVEMLSYAAAHIKGEAHVRALSRGGELLAFVWLLMAHLGCFYKPGLGIYYGQLPV